MRGITRSACAATSADDIGYENCQSWCDAIPQHCSTCKGCEEVLAETGRTVHGNYANDVREAMCEGWCQGAFHCPQAQRVPANVVLPSAPSARAGA